MAIVLIVTFFKAFIGVYAVGVGPVPQQPPEGYKVEQGQVTLQWNKGTRQGPITLQISMDDPSFSEPVYEKEVAGKTYVMRQIENGHVYYWRLIQNEKSSPVATFKTSPHAVKF